MPRRFDEEDYDRPRRKRFEDDDDGRPHRKHGGDFPVWILFALGGGVVGLVLLATAGYFLLRPARKAVAPAEEVEAIANVGGLGGRNNPPGPPGAERIVRLRANASPQQLIFGGGDDGYVGVMSFAQGGYEIEVFKISSGEEKGRIVTRSSSIDGYALSPDGAYVAEVNSAPFEGNAVTVYRTSDGQAANKFTPYPRSPRTLGQVPALSWIGFLPGNKLLSINERGGYDVWSVPDGQKLHGKDGALTGGQSLRRNGFTHTTTNFAITPDGKTLAIFDGTGFTFVNPITGEELGRTEPFTARGRSFNSWGCALNSDGTRLAFHRSQNRGSTFTVWDVKTGKQLSEVASESTSSAGFCWWGADHVLIQQGGIASADVVSLSTGGVVGKVCFPGIGKLGPTGPGDCLWGYTEGTLIRARAPSQIRPGTTFEIVPTGIQVR
jgi:hypothetical protein